MKKILFCCMGVMLICQISQAQSTYDIGFYRSFPIGDYGATDLENGGFAEPGWGFLLENKFTFPAWPEGLNIGFHFSYQENKTDEQSIGNAFSEALEGTFDVRVSAGSFRPLVATVGPFYEWKLNQKFSIDFKSGAGIMFSGIDPINLNIYNDQSELVLRERVEYQTKPDFSFMLGVNFGYQLSDYWAVNLFADYAYANESFNSSLISGSGTSSEQKISFINTGLSLSLKIH